MAVGRCGSWHVEGGMWPNCLGAVRKSGIWCPHQLIVCGGKSWRSRRSRSRSSRSTLNILCTDDFLSCNFKILRFLNPAISETNNFQILQLSNPLTSEPCNFRIPKLLNLMTSESQTSESRDFRIPQLLSHATSESSIFQTSRLRNPATSRP